MASAELNVDKRKGKSTLIYVKFHTKISYTYKYSITTKLLLLLFFALNISIISPSLLSSRTLILYFYFLFYTLFIMWSNNSIYNNCNNNNSIMYNVNVGDQLASYIKSFPTIFNFFFFYSFLNSSIMSAHIDYFVYLHLFIG